VEEARRDAGVSEAVDLIGTVNAAIADKDLERVAATLHPDIVWEHNLGGGSPEEGVYRGRTAVVELFERLVEAWESVRAEPLEFELLPDGRHFVKGEIHFKHSSSEMDVVTPYEQRLEIEDGLLVRGQMTFGETHLP
jgi:ketosteroid isomerase-like protein